MTHTHPLILDPEERDRLRRRRRDDSALSIVASRGIAPLGRYHPHYYRIADRRAGWQGLVVALPARLRLKRWSYGGRSLAGRSLLCLFTIGPIGTLP